MYVGVCVFVPSMYIALCLASFFFPFDLHAMHTRCDIILLCCERAIHCATPRSAPLYSHSGTAVTCVIPYKKSNQAAGGMRVAKSSFLPLFPASKDPQGLSMNHGRNKKAKVTEIKQTKSQISTISILGITLAVKVKSPLFIPGVHMGTALFPATSGNDIYVETARSFSA